jgi:tetratricopeptide (TPR) repeat protein
MCRGIILQLPAVLALLAFQPDPQMLRRLYEEGLAKRERDYGSADVRTAGAARDLGLYLREWGGDPAGARQALARALAIDEKTLGAMNSQTLADAADLASLSPPSEAEALWERAAAARDSALAARAFSALGELREAAGDWPGATGFYRQSLAMEEAAGGKMAARVAVRLNALALVEDPPAAVPLLERALAIDRRAWGEKHPETATTEVNLSGELLAAGRVADAVHVSTLALAGFEATLGPGHPRTAAAASTLADALRAKEDRAGAEKLYRRALEIDEMAYGPGHRETLADVKNLAEFLRETGRAGEAAALENRSGLVKQ